MFDLLDRENRLDRVSELLAARDRVDAELALAVAAADAGGAWSGCGHRSARRFLRSFGRQSSAMAGLVLGRSRLLGGHQITARAAADGKLSLGAVDAIVAVVTDRRASLYRRDEPLLVAKGAELPLEDFETLLAHWADLADNEHLEDPGLDEAPHFLSVQQRFFGGCDIWGSLDEFTSQTLLAALDAFDSGPDRGDDPAPRTLRQRQADSLGDMAAAALAARNSDSRSDGVGSGAPGRDTAPPPVSATSIVVDLPTLVGRAGAFDLDGIIAEINGRTVSGRVVEALLCNSWVSALLVDARGAVIDATERSAPFTATQRRLLAARDRHCAFPGCRRPPSQCDAHHLRPRSQGGPASLENGVLLCRRHHRLLHAGWTLRRDDSGAWRATSPTGREWTERPPPARSRSG